MKTNPKSLSNNMKHKKKIDKVINKGWMETQGVQHSHCY
jgi:hypothetical protein